MKLTTGQLRELIRKAANPEDADTCYEALDRALAELKIAKNTKTSGNTAIFGKIYDAIEIVEKLRNTALSLRRAAKHQNVKQTGHGTVT